jgi:hypothetical protein
VSEPDSLARRIVRKGKNFGGSFNSSQQVEYLVYRLSDVPAKFGDLMSFRLGNPSMDLGRHYVLNDAITFNIIHNLSQPCPDVVIISIARVLMEYAGLFEELISLGDRENPSNYNTDSQRTKSLN